MDRRTFIASTVATAAASATPVRAETDALSDILGQLDRDNSIVEDTWEDRGLSASRGVPNGVPSQLKLSPRAIEMIVAFEVSSPQAYQRKYQKPIWPHGESGVTIGVGYDLRFANRAALDRDWGMLPARDREILSKVLRKGGTQARDVLPSVQGVEIPWIPAREQFLTFLPYVAADTEEAFPNCELLSPHCFGALVSLIYNRGKSIPRNSVKRRHMYSIQQHMKAKNYAAIPQDFMDMRVIWPEEKLRGLRLRREAEAKLFQMGIPDIKA